MNNRPTIQRGRIGRPPAGVRAGERVKDYAQISVRLPDDMRAKLQALEVVTGQSRWRLIVQALECYFKNLPTEEQRLVHGICARLRKLGA